MIIAMKSHYTTGITAQNAGRAGEECLLLSEVVTGGLGTWSLDSSDRIHLALFGRMPHVEMAQI